VSEWRKGPGRTDQQPPHLVALPVCKTYHTPHFERSKVVICKMLVARRTRLALQMRSRSPSTSACLFCLLLPPPRILLNCPDVPRRFRVLPHLRKAQSRPLLPRQRRKDLRRCAAATEREVTIDCPSDCFLSRRGAPLRRRAPALPACGHSAARRKIPQDIVYKHPQLMAALAFSICQVLRRATRLPWTLTSSPPSRPSRRPKDAELRHHL